MIRPTSPPIVPSPSRLPLLAAVLVSLPSFFVGQARAVTPSPAAATTGSLYERLGGGAGITAVVDETIRRSAADKRINAKLVNADLGRLRAELVEQLCALGGGPCRYRGKDMKTAHKGMAITSAEFDALVEDLAQAMAVFNVKPREQAELIALLAPTKPDIVQASAPISQATVAGGPAAARSAPPTALAPPPAVRVAPPAATTTTLPTTSPPPGPVAERAEGLREAAGLLDKAEVERKRGNRSLADQLFSFAELIVGPAAVAALAPLFREGAPPRVTSPTIAVPVNTPPQPAAVGSSEEEEPPPHPAKGSLTGAVKLGSSDFEGLAVITLEPASGHFHRRTPRSRVVEQRSRQFAPRMLVVPTGSTVSFPNFDTVYHNVFSRSETKPFDLGLYKAGQEREVKFEKEGIVRIGCNLHVNMSAIVAVVSAPHYVITDAHGHFAFRSLDPGTYKLRTYTDGGEDAPTTQTVTIAPTKNTVTVTLSTGPRAGPLTDKFGVARAPKSPR